jgi:halocyanin-like protein
MDGEMAFAPAVIEVPPNTTVNWEWTGHGGQHNVVALDGTFDSGRTNAQAGTCYHYFFEEPGTYPFVCEPHKEEGMKGAVIVKEPPSTGNEKVDDWVQATSNFDGSIADKTGSEAATITVGAEGNAGNFAFDPPVMKISKGTTVSWEWTGNGGGHNVVFEDHDIESGDVLPDPVVHFEHTFETAGTYRYACEPHHSLGMRGAIIVA